MDIIRGSQSSYEAGDAPIVEFTKQFKDKAKDFLKPGDSLDDNVQLIQDGNERYRVGKNKLVLPQNTPQQAKQAPQDNITQLDALSEQEKHTTSTADKEHNTISEQELQNIRNQS